MSFVATHRAPISRYRPPPHRSLPPLPPRWVEQQREHGRPPRFTQFVFLSLVLHGLVITLFGAPGGGAEGGRAVWRGLREIQVMLVPAPKPDPVPLPSPRGEAETVAPAPLPQPKVDARPVMPKLLDRIAAPERSQLPPPLLVPPPSSFDMAPLPHVALPEQLPRAAPRLSESQLLPAPLLAPAPPPAVVTAPAIPRAAPRPAEAPPLVAAPRVEVPAVPTPPVAVPAPPRVEPVARPVERSLVQEIEPAAPQTALERALAREPPIAPAARVETPMPVPGSAPSSGSPLPGPSVGRPGEASTGYDPTAAPPALDADEIRKRASQLARGTGNRALLPFAMPPVDPPKSKLETVIEAARKPDCRDHYKALGLAAIVPLIANEFGEGKCKW